MNSPKITRTKRDKRQPKIKIHTQKTKLVHQTKKIVKKLSWEIIVALLTAGAIFLATYTYETCTQKNNLYKNISSLYISISNEYVEDKFGKPYITITEDSGLRSNFFVSGDVILRTVSKDKTVVAFFITSINPKSKIPVRSFDTEYKLGKSTYSDFEFPNPQIDKSIAMYGAATYYSESQGTGRHGAYNNYVIADVPYGFYDSYTSELISYISFEEEPKIEELNKLKSNATPNTFGVIDWAYIEIISIIPQSDQWDSIYYTLRWL